MPFRFTPRRGGPSARIWGARRSPLADASADRASMRRRLRRLHRDHELPTELVDPNVYLVDFKYAPIRRMGAKLFCASADTASIFREDRKPWENCVEE